MVIYNQNIRKKLLVKPLVYEDNQCFFRRNSSGNLVVGVGGMILLFGARVNSEKNVRKVAVRKTVIICYNQLSL